MRISTTQGSLNNAVQSVQRAVSSKSVLPVLAGILVTAEKGNLRLNATDLEIAIEMQTEAAVEEEGSVVLPGKLFSDIVRNLPESKISISLDTKTSSANLQSGNSNFSFKVYPAEDFPAFPKIEGEFVDIEGGVFKEAINQVTRAASRDETRPVLQGVFVKLEDDKLKLAATDSYRLAVREVAVKTKKKKMGPVVIPARALEEVGRLLEGTETLGLGINENNAIFKCGQSTVLSRLIEGAFPNYEQLLPTSYGAVVKMDKAETIAALKRVSLLAPANQLIRMNMTDGSIQMSCVNTELGSASERLDAEIKGEGMDIAFNGQFLLDGLNCINEASCDLELNSPTKPGIIRSSGKDDFLYLVMPIRLSGEQGS